MKRRIAAVLLALCMCIGLLPATALAVETGTESAGVTDVTGGEPFTVLDASVDFRLDTTQLYKLLMLQAPETSAETEINSVYLLLNQKHGVLGTEAQLYSIGGENRDTDWYNCSGNYNWNHTLEPSNIRGLRINYTHNGQGGTAEISPQDLRLHIELGPAGLTADYTIMSSNDEKSIVAFYDNGGNGQQVNYSLYDAYIVDTGSCLNDINAWPTTPTYTEYTFVNWDTYKGGGAPFLGSTIVNEDTQVFSQKITTDGTSAGTEIHVMNRNNELIDPFVELYNAKTGRTITSNDVILNDQFKITVYGEGNTHTNPDYSAGIGPSDYNHWMANNEYYMVVNRDADVPVAFDENWNIQVNHSEITKIVVSAQVKLSDETVIGEVTINKGTAPGDFAVSFISNTIIELHILQEGEVEGEPDLPNPDPEPDPDPDPAITDFTKTLVKTVQEATAAGISGTYAFPNSDNKVIIPYGESVTLLYAITVTGDAGTAFTVTDKDAELVEVTGVDIEEDAAADTFSGSIPEDATEITFYVSKTFKAEDLGTNNEGDQVLTNTATVVEDGGGEDDSIETEDETPAEEESYKVYTYVRFVNENGTDLTEDDKTEIKEIYGGTVNNDGYVAIGTFEIPMPDPAEEPYAPAQGGSGKGGPNVIGNEQYAALWEAVQEDLTKDNFTPISGDIKIELDDIDDWVKLSTAHGAENFGVGSEIACWHLDGQIQLYDSDITVVKTLTQIERADDEGATSTITNITDETALEVGDKLTWTITVTNSGNAAAEGLTISDELTVEPKDEIERTAQLAMVGNEQWTAGSTFTVPAAENGFDGEVTFTATYEVTEADKGLTLTNTATVSDGDDDDTEGEDDTNNPVADRKVEIEKKLIEVNDEPYTEGAKVNVGDKLTYEIKVTNTGNVPLEDVTIKDSLWKDSKEVIHSIEWNPEPNYCSTDYSGSATFDLGADATVTITYTYTVQDTDAGTTIKNTANVVNDEDDDDIDDNDGDTEEVEVKDPDDSTIVVKPVDITIYMGGTGYKGTVVDETSGGLITDTKDAGFPEPGFTVTLPAALSDVDVTTLIFKEANGGGRTWKFQPYDGQTGTTVYKLVPQGEGQDPIRVSFVDPETDELVTSDKFDVNLHVNQTLTISLYKGDEGSEVGEIEVVYNGETYTVNSDATADLTVRGTTDGEKYAELNKELTKGEPGLKADESVTYTTLTA